MPAHVVLAIPHRVGSVELVIGLRAIERDGVEGEDILRERVATGQKRAAAAARTFSDIEWGTEVDAVFYDRVGRVNSRKDGTRRWGRTMELVLADARRLRANAGLTSSCAFGARREVVEGAW